MGENKAKRQYTGCNCGCGRGTWGRYAPGHDAKHVAQLVRWTIEAKDTGSIYQTTTRWRSAIKQLGSYQLQWKYRRAMIASANKHLESTIAKMADERWQAAIHLARDIQSVDPIFGDLGLAGTWYLASIAAAMGMDRHSVNLKHS